MFHRFLLLIVIPALVFVSCEEEPKRSLKKGKPTNKVRFVPIERPEFNADNAYQYIKTQVDFGPRVPGTPSHKRCAEYLEKELSQLGMETQVQEAKVTSFDGVELPIYNITGRFNSENPNRIMLFAHWDTRPFADRDTKDKKKPILGANDGASGVGVLLEIARIIAQDSLKPSVGIDIVFFDAEDYGQPSGTMQGAESSNTWCLGSQYWANNLPEDFVRPKYGILLDMVGSANATFPKEAGSIKYNSSLVSNVWFIANKLGYGKYFIQDVAGGGITDDHVPVSVLANIPSIDIIHYDPRKRDFGHFHHRHSDNMDVIDKNTLHAVGETVLEVIYREK
ncbi:MAG: hypothetical protein CL840_09345 [Crocinitomicaceae bacterium]|nr:hypothetical protein [Crocinitomicaceae bacterium]|tara:strand:+ start:15600 stop:16610 length:1011 start_codon:yes stop_codon:yes gene_type:complete